MWSDRVGLEKWKIKSGCNLLMLHISNKYVHFKHFITIFVFQIVSSSLTKYYAVSFLWT